MWTRGSSRDHLDSVRPLAGEEVEHLDEGGRGVEGGQEAGEDEPALLAGGEADPLGARPRP